MKVLYSAPGAGPNAMMDNSVAVGELLAQRTKLYLFARADNKFLEPIRAIDSYTYYLSQKNPSTFLESMRMSNIRKYAFSKGIDVVFSQSNRMDLLTWRYLEDFPRVVYLHDPFPHEGTSFANRIIQQLGRDLYLRKADSIIVSSNAMRKSFTESFAPKKANVEVIKLGALENLKFSLNATESDIDVLFFGRIQDYKGLDVLFSAAQLLPSAKFVVIGRGSVEIYAPNGCLPANVCHIDDYVEDRELAEFVNRSSIVVMPYTSATGTQVIQTANYYRKPVVASRVGGLPEYIVDGVTGCLVDPGNPELLAASLSSLLNNSNRRKSMGEAAFEYVSAEYDQSTLTDRYLAVLERARRSHIEQCSVSVSN